MKNQIVKKLAAVVMIGLTVSVATVFSTVQVQAASRTTVIAAGVMTNLVPNPPNGQATISSVLLTAPAGSHASVQIFDTWTNVTKYTNASYSVLSTFATNVITTYTNYFGVTNSFTNLALLTITNTVAASTNAYPIVFAATAPTNSSVLFDNNTYTFDRGVWATNVGPSSLTITITYQE